MKPRSLALLGLLVLIAPAVAGEWPVRTAGLWEITLTSTDATRPAVVQQCTTAEIDMAMLLALVPGQEHCTVRPAPMGSSGVLLQTQCRVHESLIRARISIQGDFRQNFSAHYVVRVAGHVAGQAPGRGTNEGDLHGKFLGPCPEGAKPGDTRLSNGIVVHVHTANIVDHVVTDDTGR